MGEGWGLTVSERENLGHRVNQTPPSLCAIKAGKGWSESGTGTVALTGVWSMSGTFELQVFAGLQKQLSVLWGDAWCFWKASRLLPTVGSRLEEPL